MQKTLIILSIIIFILSIYVSNNILISTYNKEESSKNITAYYEKKESDVLGIISIDKIKLNKEFYKINSSSNDVNKNIKVIKYEDNVLVLASHSGSNYNAYFNDILKLNINDEINIDINSKKKTYILNDIYDELKDGRINLYYNNKKDTLILITCNRKNKLYQRVFVSYRKE